MGEIHELFVLALSLVWFAGATPDTRIGNLNPGIVMIVANSSKLKMIVNQA